MELNHNIVTDNETNIMNDYLSVTGNKIIIKSLYVNGIGWYFSDTKIKNPEPNKDLLFDLWNRINKIDGKCVICNNNISNYHIYCCKYNKEGLSYHSDIRRVMIKRLNKLISKYNKEGKCKYCNCKFNMKRKDSIYCSDKCRIYNHREVKNDRKKMQ